MARLPESLGTETQFKRVKRKQFKQLCSFIETCDIRNGCAYLPSKEHKQLVEGIEMVFKARNNLRAWWEHA